PAQEKLPRGVTRPTWIVLDLQGSYPARTPRNPLQRALSRTMSLEALDDTIDDLVSDEWLHGVLVRVGDLEVGAATAMHLRRSLERLSKEKRTVAHAARLDMTSLLVASAARELAVPESAELYLTGFTMEVTFLGEFLRRHGVNFENVRIREYKSALTRYSEDRMDPY
ncbi:S49 family peptidase, partial [Deinococcus pimensis]|uniref:S49 family peptidase n=1 Tax=Deinococcus pimensis TaxID=309888 RepID=UPI0005EBBBF5